MNWFSKERLNVLSGLFTNLAAGWFGVVFIVPGITKLDTLADFGWLIKNLGLGIVSLFIAFKIAGSKKE